MLLAALCACSTTREPASVPHWVGTWGTAVVARSSNAQTLQQPPATSTVPAASTARPGPNAPALSFDNQTLRQIVHVSIGGDEVRVVLSNAFGSAPLNIGAAHVSLREAEARVSAQSDRTLLFGGSPSVTIPPGAVLFSDPVDLSVPAFADLVIDAYLPGRSESAPMVMTTHGGALQTNYVSNIGNYAGASEFPVKETFSSWYFLARVEIVAPTSTAAVVAFGDSITDGTRSTPNKNHRWPDFLALRLADAKISMGMLNEGIAGNRVLGDGAGVSALARFDRDALLQTGVTHIIVLESINDIGLARSGPTPSASDLILAHKQLIARAHARGLKIFGATLTPFMGAGYATVAGEAKRQAINEWIRASKEYDGVVDFDKAVRDPADPAKLRAEFNPGDNLHMNDAGYEAMANAVDLKLFAGH